MTDVPLPVKLKTVLVAQDHRLAHVHSLFVEMEKLLVVRSAMMGINKMVFTKIQIL